MIIFRNQRSDCLASLEQFYDHQGRRSLWQFEWKQKYLRLSRRDCQSCSVLWSRSVAMSQALRLYRWKLQEKSVSTDVRVSWTKLWSLFYFYNFFMKLQLMSVLVEIFQERPQNHSHSKQRELQEDQMANSICHVYQQSAQRWTPDFVDSRNHTYSSIDRSSV